MQKFSLAKTFLLFALIEFGFAAEKVPKLLLIAYDGLRYDFVNPTKMPNLYQLGKNGVFSQKGLHNLFRTVTTPNFYTISTGLNIESHGIFGNQMFDPTFENGSQFFNYWADPKSEPEIYEKSRDSRWFYGEPIWLTNQKNGGKSGSMRWPTADAKISVEIFKFFQISKYFLLI